jgi:hypothetical protein
VREGWGYLTEYGPRRGTPPAGSDYEPIATLGPDHLSKAAAIVFETQRGLNSGQAVAWGAQGVVVMADGLRWHVSYRQIRSITPPTAASSGDLVKSPAIDTRKTSDVYQPGDEILLRGDRVARVQHVGAGVIHVVRDDGIYHRARPRDVAKVLRRAPRPRADQVAAPLATPASADGEAETSLTPELFAVNDLIAWQSGRLQGIALVEQVLPSELHVITLPGGSLVHHQRVRLTVEELRPLPVELLRTAEPGDLLRLLVQDGLETAVVERPAHDGAYVKSPDGELTFVPWMAVAALHRGAAPHQPGATMAEPVAPRAAEAS